MLIGEATIKFAIGMIYVLTIEDLRRILSKIQGNVSSLMSTAQEIGIYTTVLVLCLLPNVLEIVTSISARFYFVYFSVLFMVAALLQLLTTSLSIVTLKTLANKTFKTLWQAYSHEVVNLSVVTCLFVLSSVSVVLCGFYLQKNSGVAVWIYAV